MEASLVAVQKGERRAGSGQGFKGQGQSNGFSVIGPLSVNKLALGLHFGVKDSGLDRGIAGHAPVCGGELADEIHFGFVGGFEMLDVLAEFGFELLFGLVGEHDGLGRQAMFEGVEGGGATAILSFRTAGLGSIATGGFDSGRHIGSPGASVAGRLGANAGRATEVIRAAGIGGPAEW